MSDATPRIYLSSPHMGGEEMAYIQDAFEKNWIAPLGANVDGFEKDLENYTGRSHAAVVTSGTAAIHLGLILCGVEPGDEVICQSFTFTATANPIRYLGATPVFVDSEAETWNMDPDLLERALAERMEAKRMRVEGVAGDTLSGEYDTAHGERQAGKPKAIILVHLYGMPANVDRILEIADMYDIPVIEDSAEALGSSIGNRKCGTFGRVSVLSFNGNKIITTSGGGALLSDNEQLVKKARFLATQARDEAPHYQHSELGYNYRMSNILAGIGRGQMKVLDRCVAARRANHDFYFRALNGVWLEPRFLNTQDSRLSRGIPLGTTHDSSSSGIYFLKEPDQYFSNRWLTTILVNPDETGGVTREDLYNALEEENIESRPLWKPMHMQPLYRQYPFYGNGVSEALFRFGLCLPSGSNLGEEERMRVVATIRKTLGR